MKSREVNKKGIIIALVIALALSIAIFVFLLLNKVFMPTDSESETYRNEITNFEQDIEKFYAGEENRKNVVDIENELLDYINNHQQTCPNCASSARVTLAQFYDSIGKLDSAISLLEKDLQYDTVDNEHRYIVFARLSTYYEEKNDIEMQKKYIKSLLKLEDVKPQYENWEEVKNSFQEKLNNLENENE